jgi:cell division protein YceG involved in septum cleavage
MNRNIIIFVVVIILILAVGAGVYIMYSATPAQQTGQQPSSSNNANSVSIPPPSNNQTAQAVAATYQAALSKDNVDNIKLYQTVVDGNYALQVWRGNITSGEALLKFDPVQYKWVIVDPGGGSWTIADLVVLGVPAATATALWKGLQQ